MLDDMASAKDILAELRRSPGQKVKVAVTDVDARYNMGYRRGWVTVGVVGHGASPLPGHGPGMTPILTGPTGSLRTVPDAAGHVGLTAAAVQLQ